MPAKSTTKRAKITLNWVGGMKTVRPALALEIKGQDMAKKFWQDPLMVATLSLKDREWAGERKVMGMREDFERRLREMEERRKMIQERGVPFGNGMRINPWELPGGGIGSVDMPTAISKPTDNRDQVIDEQNKELKRIASEPTLVGYVVSITKEHVFVVANGNDTMRVAKPAQKVKMGDVVVLHAQTKQIIEVQKEFHPVGAMHSVKEVRDGGFIEVEVNGAVCLVRVPGNAKEGFMAIKAGDRVLVDKSNSVVLANYGQTQKAYTPDTVPNVTWDDIGGLEDAKLQMIEAVEAPHKNKELFEHYGKKPPKGVLLYGPPGCGKTMLGKAAANSLAKTYQKDGAATAFMYIKGPEVLNKFVGESEATIRSLFARAKAHKAEHGYPAVVFIDEADALLVARGSKTNSGMESTVVPQFLTEMDGMEDSGALVILATNRPDTLDPAVVRDGRIDRKIKITRPTYESTQDIFKLGLKKVPLAKGVKAEAIVEAATAAMFDEGRVFYEVHKKDGSVFNVCLYHFLNGGMVAGVVDYAMQLAMRRDMEAKTKTGIMVEDIIAAIENIDRQNRDLNHEGEVDDLVEPFKDEVAGMAKVAYKAPIKEVKEAKRA